MTATLSTLPNDFIDILGLAGVLVFFITSVSAVMTSAIISRNGFLHLANLPRHGIALRLQLLNLGQEPSALLVELKDGIDGGVLHLAIPEGGADEVRLFTNEIQVQHDLPPHGPRGRSRGKNRIRPPSNCRTRGRLVVPPAFVTSPEGAVPGSHWSAAHD